MPAYPSITEAERGGLRLEYDRHEESQIIATGELYPFQGEQT